MAEVSFGEWLKRRRAAEGWSQEQLAQKIHCSTSALRKFESEERRPSTGVVEQLAQIFSIPDEERPSFLHFARGDWQAYGDGNQKKISWRESNIEQNSNLPSLITSFIGREREQKEVILLLKNNRLVTLAGIGGIGKTRLAIQVGHRLLRDYPHGVWFMPLDSLSDPLLVPQTIASMLGIREDLNRPVIETLKHVLRGKTSLLILDNCEHLLDTCAQLITTILTHCPNLRILVTSRELVTVEGEGAYYLTSLSTPEGNVPPEDLAEYESIRLFVERATLKQSSFQLTRENAQPIMDICRRVDGIPLAVELTAAHINFLNVEEISKQLSQSFALLAGDHRSTLSRHQSLQASLDWSWSLLSGAEQVFLRQLSVFAGGWTLEAAASVCVGNTLILTKVLVQKSLIKVEHALEKETRYYFHEMVRQYAREKLLKAGDAQSICDKHLAYFVQLAEQAEPELYRSNQVIWFNKLDDERDNLRLALEWALATDVKSGLRIVTIPWRFWQRHDSREAGNWLRQLLERYRTPDTLRAQALAVLSEYFFTLGFTGEAQQVAEQALQLARTLSDQQNEALSLMFLGRELFLDDHQVGITHLRRSLDLYRALGDKIGQATAIGWLSNNNDDRERSTSLLEESLKLHRELGNLSGVAYCLAFLGYHAIMRGDFASPGPRLEEARTLYHELADQYYEAFSLEYLGVLADRLGDHQKAYTFFEHAITLFDTTGGFWASWPRVRIGHALLREGNLAQARNILEMSIEEFHRNGHVLGVGYTIEGFASLYVIQGQLERATQLVAWADAIREKLGSSRPPVEQGDIDKDITTCLARMGEAAFSDAYEEGKKMSLEEAVAYALEES